jgi:hypothetical protein
MIKSLLIYIFLLPPSLYSQSADSLHNKDDDPRTDSTFYAEYSDSLCFDDSLLVKKNVVIPDTLIPIQETPLSVVTNIINRRTFLFENYRYTGDFLRIFPLNFVKDLSFLGQPNESFIYGAGFGGVSFMEDGLLRNDRYSNSLNLNEVQSEDIDSIEVVPSPRGFLFGPLNNPVSVNFIMKDFISPEPYTRIKYYEGPDGEAMIDGKFNARIYNRWNLSFQVTNRAADNRYINTDYSMWQINAKLKYFLSNKINITAMYNSVDSEIGLNGGVDVDSIAKLTSDINSILYDNQLAVVNYNKRIQKVLNHNFRLKTQLLPWNNSKADISFFYRYSDNEISNDLDSVVLLDRYDNKNYGVDLNFHQALNIFSVQLFSTYEKNSTRVYANNSSVHHLTVDHDYFSVGAVISSELANGKIIPSVFYKYSNQDYTKSVNNYVNNNSGLGIDLFYNIFKNFSLYAGYSKYSQFDFGDSENIELAVNYTNKFIDFDVKYFNRENFIPYNPTIPYWTSIEIAITPKDIQGIGVKANIKFWKFIIETNTSHYFGVKGYDTFTPPEVQFSGGFYLNDYFFDESLLLKTGFKFYYTGSLSDCAENSGFVQVDPSNKIDFTLAGEIKKVAIVYFIWENLAGNNYFITPYYPMPERNIRFGLSWELFN